SCMEAMAATATSLTRGGAATRRLRRTNIKIQSLGSTPMHDDVPAYGLWSLVIINSAVFIIFAFSFFKPQTQRDWRSFSAFSAFLVALFTEMYGFPLTIYLLSGWLQSKFPGVDWFSHDAGHLLEMMFGWKANPHF